MKSLTPYALMFFLILVPALSRAQIDRTELVGTVTDPSGASVAGVAEGTNQLRTVTTDEHG
jgi:hypothetical protein